MAAPTFVQASNGATDSMGTFTFTGVAAGTIGDLVILQILVDGTGAISWGSLTNTNINKLDGTAGWDEIGIFFAGAAAQQRIFIGRRTSASSAPTFTAASNTSGDDVYGRMYEFHNVSTGTALATVIENSAGQTVSWPTGNGSFVTVGFNAGAERAAAGFVAPASLAELQSVTVKLKKTGDPQDNLILAVQADSGGHPSDTDLAIATVAGTSLSTSSEEKTYSLAASLTPDTTYWLVARRSGANNTSNYYSWEMAATGSVVRLQTYSPWSADSVANDITFTGTFNSPSTSGVTSSNTASDAAVTTLGPDRLALNFIGVNDDNAISAFTGETGGDWTLAVAPYADSGGTDGAIGLQATYPGINLVRQESGIAANNESIGPTSNFARAAQSFLMPVTGPIESVEIQLAAANGSPADGLTADIQTDSAGSPSGSSLGSATIASPTASAWNKFTFSSPISLSSATTYWIVVSRTGAYSADYHKWIGTVASSYANGEEKRYDADAGTWGAGAIADTNFRVHQPNAAGTIDGGTGSIVDIDSWGVVGFALIGTTPTPPTTRQPRNPAVNFQDPAYV